MRIINESNFKDVNPRSLWIKAFQWDDKTDNGKYPTEGMEQQQHQSDVWFMCVSDATLNQMPPYLSPFKSFQYRIFCVLFVFTLVCYRVPDSNMVFVISRRRRRRCSVPSFQIQKTYVSQLQTHSIRFSGCMHVLW